MFSKDDKAVTQIVCPGLGLLNDQSDHRMVAILLHNCYLQTKPEMISLTHQEAYCLSENYINCPIYQKKSHLYYTKTTPKASEILKPGRHSFKLNFASSITLFAMLSLLVLIIILVIFKTSPFATPESVSSSSNDPYLAKTYNITPTKFTPYATWHAQLTQQAIQNSRMSGTPSLISGLFPTRTSIVNTSPTIIRCDKPDGWIVYIVDDGDTIQSLSRLTNMTVLYLMATNCMATNSLAIGQRIFLPYYPGSATVTMTPNRSLARTPTSPLPPTSKPIFPTATYTSPPPATNTFVPTATYTKNPLFKDTPTQTDTPTP